MSFDIKVFMELKDSTTNELKMLVGGALLQEEHGMFDLHEEQNYRSIPGHDSGFSTDNVQRNSFLNHAIHDPIYGSAESIIDAGLPLLEYCLDEQLGIEKCDSFIDSLDLREMRSLYEDLKSQGLLSECSSGLMLSEAVFGYFESRYVNKVPLVALSIIIGRNLFKRRF